MKFSLIANGVQNEMFRVIHASPTHLRYEEKNRTLTIPIEQHLDNSIDIHLFRVTRWDAPAERERLDEGRRQMIEFRLRSALIFEGFSPEFGQSSVFAPEGTWSISGLNPNFAIS